MRQLFFRVPGCHIYESIGIPVQKTLLGTFTVKGKEKIVVVCRDSFNYAHRRKERNIDFAVKKLES